VACAWRVHGSTRTVSLYGAAPAGLPNPSLALALTPALALALALAQAQALTLTLTRWAS